MKAVEWLLKRDRPRRRFVESHGGRDVVLSASYPPGQWHRWYAANARNRRQLRAYKQIGGGWGHRLRIDPRLADLRRWMVK
jgi:hypothetical protein